MKVPKLYSPVKIKFWSLRNEIGPNLGIMFDCDREVERVVMRVIGNNGWKWQIKNLRNISKWDFSVEQDQEVLDQYGSDLEYEIVT